MIVLQTKVLTFQVLQISCFITVYGYKTEEHRSAACELSPELFIITLGI
jgi:hypothetical protein